MDIKSANQSWTKQIEVFRNEGKENDRRYDGHRASWTREAQQNAAEGRQTEVIPKCQANIGTI